MPKIDVDDEVFTVLQQEAEPFVDTPNDVLRRKLLSAEGTQPARPSRRQGDLMPLIRGGRIAGGDNLMYHQKRKVLTHHAVVTDDGWVEANGQTYRQLSPSLRDCVGTQINGWFWVHVPTGKQLRTLRAELTNDEGR